MVKIPSQTPSQIILLNCEYCNKKFTRKDNLKRHIKLYCKKKNNKFDNIINNNNNNNNNNVINNNFINNNFINNNNNNNNNITINNTINNFGREKLDNISDNDIFRCINMCYDGTCII